MKHSSDEPYGSELRQRAERFLQQRDESLTDLDAANVHELVHELHLHQTELQMQNDELRHAQALLQAQKARNLELYDHAPVGHFDVSADGFVKTANTSCALMLGLKRADLIGRRFAVFIDEGSRIAYQEHVDAVFADSRRRHSCEVSVLNGDKRSYLRVDSLQLLHEKQLKPVCVSHLTDVSEARNAMSALQGSWDVAFDMLVRIDGSRVVHATNSVFATAFEREAADLVGIPFEQLLHPEDRDRASRAIAALRPNETTTFHARPADAHADGASIEWRAKRDAATDDTLLAGRTLDSL